MVQFGTGITAAQAVLCRVIFLVTPGITEMRIWYIKADCEKEHIGESLQEMYNVMAFLPCFPTYNSKIFSFVSIILTVNNLFVFCIILFP